jgi:hypothetical protein
MQVDVCGPYVIGFGEQLTLMPGVAGTTTKGTMIVAVL